MTYPHRTHQYGAHSMNEKFRTQIHQLAQNRGLEFLGVTAPKTPRHFDKFESWIQNKKHAGMKYLECHAEIRGSPKKLLESVKSILVFGLPYYLGDNPSGDTQSPLIAQYARRKDYHRCLKRQLGEILTELKKNWQFESRILVDSAPFLEKDFAATTLHGFMGKNTCYIHAKMGSFFLLGEALLSLDLEPDPTSSLPLNRKTQEGGCGPCNLCQTACPTGALNTDYSIDSNRCLAYWTIEHRGIIPFQFWPYLKQYYFGCDICQLACPYNAKLNRPQIPDWPELSFPSLFETATMNQYQYEKYFGGTPLTRATRNGLRRNALIALAVIRDTNLEQAITLAQKDSAFPIAETIEMILKWLMHPFDDGSCSHSKTNTHHL